MQNFQDYYNNFSNVEKIAILPGGFKPPTKGHFKALEYLLQETDKGIVFIGNKDRDGITAEMSKQIWDIYVRYLPKSIEVQISGITPVKDVYDFAEKNTDKVIVVGAGDKDEDVKRYAYFEKNIDKFPLVKVVKIPIQGDGISGTKTRELIQTDIKQGINYFVPDQLSDKDKSSIASILNK